jgi:predicted ATP-binding protein involved in virulence
MRIKKISIFGLFDMFNHEIPLNQAEHITILYGMNGMGKTTVFKIIDAFFKNNLHHFPFRELKIEMNDGTIHQILKENNGFNYLKDQEPMDGFLEEEIKKIGFNTYFIDSQRLIRSNSSSNVYHSFQKSSRLRWGAEPEENIYHCNEDFLSIIESLHNSRSYLLTNLRFSLADRVVKGNVNTDYTKEQLVSQINELNKKIEKLEAIRLLLPDFVNYSSEIESLSPIQMAILATDVQDMQKILEVYDEIYEKLALFLEILNERRLVFKKISIDLQKGFIITNDKGEILSLTQLSAGEQNELILLYFLLFKIPSNSLIMIDEPEISLHIDWQHEFIQDMEEIIKLRGFDVMLATHSPDIVNGRSELTVSLNKNEIEPYSN